VVDKARKNDEITHSVIADRNIGIDLSIKEWYKKGIQDALSDSNRDHNWKIFNHKHPL
jgi:hypothetical protein